jgi:lysophospholipase L1-like esterase
VSHLAVFRKEVRLQALLLLLTVASLVTLGEIGIRALHYFKYGIPFVSLSGSSSRSLMEYDETLGWRVGADRDETYQSKDIAGAVYPVRYRTGPHGFRQFGNPDTSDTKILVVGDSYTHAVDVSNEQTYYALLQQRLSEKAPTQVFAYGASGYGTLQEVLIVEKIVSLVRPQIVILQVCGNDIINNSYELEIASYFNNNRRARPYLDGDGAIRLLTPQSKSSRAMTELAAYSRMASWTLVRFDTLMASTAKARTVEHEIASRGFDHPGFRRSVEVTERLFARLRRALPTTVKLYAFNISRPRTHPFSVSLDALLAQEGFTLIDGVADAVQEARLRGEPVLAADGAHWAAPGHRIAANVIADKILASLKPD